MYTQGSPAEIQTPAHCNLINQSMTTPLSKSAMGKLF